MEAIEVQLDFDPVWVKDGGERVHLSEMSNVHISNCITCIEQGVILRWGCNDITTVEWLSVFKKELAGRNLLVVRPL